eukprot:GILJ01007185.1.p1 GENE.GILJ01007185.1~~GILJ01007185.1.p1  ORF type:complete len:649 (+),score=110.23 GILJ01007185.1:37-1947(+)
MASRVSLLLSALVALTFLSSTYGQLSWSKSGLDDIKGELAFFGDFNADKYTDVFVIAENRSSVDVFLWNNGLDIFERIVDAHIDTDLPIQSIIATDLNYDGRMDLLVSVLKPSSKLHHYIYTGDKTKLALFADIPMESTGQVSLVDIDDDMLTDLVGSGTGTDRLVWKNDATHKFDSTVPFLSLAYANDSVTATLPALSTSSSHLLADMNGDCLTDLLLVSVGQGGAGHKALELWLNTKATPKAYSYHASWNLPQGTGQITVADFDSDGALDISYPVCWPAATCGTTNEIHIHYNQQTPMCSNPFSSGEGCRAQDSLCAADNNFVLSGFGESVSSEFHIVIPSSSFGGNAFAVIDDLHPITLRPGDLDSDSFPDFTIVLTNGASNFASIWYSVPCSGAAECSAVSNKRTFRRDTSSSASTLEDISSALTAAFFDFGEDGVLDILVSSTANSHQALAVMQNHLDSDVFFLKVLGLNGVCGTDCDGGPPYGVNAPGISFKFTYTDLDGDKHAQQGAQLYCSSYLCLQNPFSLYGLGRTNNYIEEFYMGVTIKSTHANMWISVIPDSQLIAFPNPLGSPDYWTLQLFVSPSSKWLAVAVGTIVALAVVGILVVFFDWREKAQDRKEKEETAHLFSFDAL